MSKLKLDNISYKIKNKSILDSVSLEAESGDIMGLVGSNGAGKSSLLEIITGVIKKYDGSITYDSTEISKIRNFEKNIGFVSQDIALYEKLSGYENLKFWSKVYGIGENEIQDIVVRMGMEDYIGDKVSTYSGGMKRKLNMASGIMHYPKIIVMDEPLVGIDKNWIGEILEIIKNLSEEGRIIIITSHRFQDFSKIWNKICILKDGNIVKIGNRKDLLEEIKWSKKIKFSANEDLLGILQTIEGIECIFETAIGIEVTVDKMNGNMDRVLDIIKSSGVSYNIISVQSAEVEDLYQLYK